MKRSRPPALVAAAAALTLAACSAGQGDGAASGAGDGGSTGAVSVVASTDVWGDVASRVAGSGVDVTSIITNPDQDPHDYVADARQQLALSEADVVVENGGGYDDFVDTMLSASASRPVVVNAVDVSGFAATQGDSLNEHVWYDYPTVVKVAGAIARALAEVAPADAPTFEANLRAFTADVRGLEKAAAAVRTAHAGAGVAITEPVPLYLLDAMGLVDRTPPAFSTAVEEETDAPATVLRQTLDLFSAHEVSALVYNGQTTGVQTALVLKAAQQAGIPAVAVQETLPEGSDYVSWQGGLIARIAAALRG